MPYNSDLAYEKMAQAVGEEGRNAVLWNPHAKAIFDVAVRELAATIPFPMHWFADQYADAVDMQRWADSIMNSREPDFTIGGDYMLRWYIIPRNETMNLYLHNTLRSDEDVMHDHPWDNTSLVITGGYIEHTPDGSFVRQPGDVISRKATDAHRLELIDGRPSVSLFLTGPKVRDWGFHCPKGWVSWQDFTGGYHAGRSEKSAGCGEFA